MPLKNTPLTQIHADLGARMVPFAGYYMPIEYSGISTEHNTVRTALGVFDVSHMGEIWVKGTNALDFIQHVCSNDASTLTEGKVQYSCFPNGNGGIVDDLLVYMIDSQTYLLVVNASNIQKDWDWLCQHAPKFGLTIGGDIYDASSETAQLAIQGPMAIRAMQKLTPTPIEGMVRYTFKKVTFAGVEDVILSATGYTGEEGCEIYFPNSYATGIWQAVMEAGAEFGIKPIGLGARDTLRLEMGYCLYGNDINDSTSPIEAGLGWITKLADGKNLIGRELIESHRRNGVGRKLIGFEMIDRGIPRQHYKILNSEDEIIGEVTSGTMSPSLRVGIGMGYVSTPLATPNATIHIDVRGRLLRARVVKPPFYRRG